MGEADVADWSALELLDLEMELLWGAETEPDLVIASARGGMRMRIRAGMPEALARTLASELESATPSSDVNVPPPVVARVRLQLEDAFGAAVGLARGSGPSFLVAEGLVSPAKKAQLVRSEAFDVSALEDANPGSWPSDEWQNLLAGRIGAWVMAMVDQRIVSICHTPVSNGRAAEAGVWTHPDFRGQGYAAACTAEWANLMRPSGRVLFYSTSRDNRSSQHVAARLGLRQLGCLWQLSRESAVSG